MFHSLRFAMLLAIAATSLTACHRAADDVQPITVVGEWRLTLSGGGITGKMDRVPASSDTRLVFGPDSAYFHYHNGQLLETSTFQLRRQPSYPGGPDEQLLLLKTANTPTGQAVYYPYHLTTLTATELAYTTGGGCALNYVYERVGKALPPNINR